MNLLSTIGRGIKGAGKGILSGIDNAAVGSLTGGGLMDAALGSNGQPFTPTDQQRKGLRGQYLMGIGSALQQGRPIAEGIQQYQQNAIGQIQAGQQAQQQQKARTMREAFQTELQSAADDAVRQKVMIKWAPFFPKEVQDLAGAIKATKPDADEAIGQPFEVRDKSGNPVLVQRFKLSGIQPVSDYMPKAELRDRNIGGAIQVVDARTGLPAPGVPNAAITRTPDSVAQDQRTQPLATDQGIMSYNPMTSAVTAVKGPNGGIISAPHPAQAEPGAWSVIGEVDGKMMEHNSKTGEVRPVGSSGIQKVGTAAAKEKLIAPLRDAIAYVDRYMTGQKFTGPGDLALQEKFFEAAKPSTGFRQNQAVLQKLADSQSWIGSIQGQVYHAATGRWFSDTQRKEIVDTMKEIYGLHVPSGSGNSGVRVYNQNTGRLEP